MSRKTVWSFSPLGLVLIAAVTLNCGGSNSTAKGCTGGPYNVEGVWKLAFSSMGSSVSGIGVISSSGQALFFQTSTNLPAPGDTWVLPDITGTCSFSGATISYSTPSSGGSIAGDQVTGNVNSATSISATTTTGNSFAFTSVSPLAGSVMVPAHTMFAQIEGSFFVDKWQLTFSPFGNNSSAFFNGSDGEGCTLTGAFTQQGTSNVFDVLITYSGCDLTGTLVGLGFESNSDYFRMNGGAAGTYLYAVSSRDATVFEIFP